ncbi:glycosyltransferase family 2 protein [Luteimonas soli]|uniref:Glycosyltransferase family 2 protein n=1 Tax=Luteimonas soli TaxID=1648966 RepID=A0ABV7XIK4_9GAMM
MNSRAGGPRPQLSIITAVRNGAGHLESCLESVATQESATIQHVVIDGGSTDGTVDILRRWSGKIDTWISEPDKGISDAMNKGLRLATGEWVLFLHADDELLAPDSISQVLQALDLIDARIAGFPIRYGQPGASRLLRPWGNASRLRFKTWLKHQGTFVKRSVFEDVGMHDETLRIAMDYDFFLRAWLKGVPIATFPSPVPTLMRDTGISSRTDWPSLRQRFAEERRIHAAHCHGLFWKLVYAVYWSTYPAYRRAALAARRAIPRYWVGHRR